MVHALPDGEDEEEDYAPSVNQRLDVGATMQADLFPSTDALANVSNVFVATVGRELSGDALAALVFLERNGSPDLAAHIMSKKIYQASSSDVKGMIEKLSPASYAKEMMQEQAKLRNRDGL